MSSEDEQDPLVKPVDALDQWCTNQGLTKFRRVRNRHKTSLARISTETEGVVDGFLGNKTLECQFRLLSGSHDTVEL